MRKIIAIVGEPAVGKSSIIKRFMKSVDDWQSVEPEKLVNCEYSPKHHLHIIGKYLDVDDLFPGSDKLSMAVQPQAIKFIQNSNSNVLFEGDRLGSASFLEFLVDHPLTDFKLIVVTAAPETIESRHTSRKDEQTEQFKRSRQTKIDNIRSNMVLMGYTETMPNENLSDQSKIVQYLVNELLIDNGVVK